ncbi:MAG: haloacid dehalogenase, partial [Chloroflexia bacterium]|nr:haloacid dehalogenase [Chloroflexia bacterium]
MRAVQTLEPEATDADGWDQELGFPPALRERRGQTRRVRIAVRGLDRDPDLARRVVEHLERRPGVQRATASALTGRVLVEIADDAMAFADVVADVADLELPALPGEDRPTHPLEPGPLVRSATRTVGAALGIGLLAGRRLVGAQGPPVGGTRPAAVAGMIGILQGFPSVRSGLRGLLGPDVADLAFTAASIVSLTLAGSPLGLALTGLEAFRLFTEARARRETWRGYEERREHTGSPQPGTVTLLEAGERTPLAARVVEGTGTAAGPDGLPVPVTPGVVVTAGMPLHGGPFLLELQSGPPFMPKPRSGLVADSVYDRYVRAVGPLSLAYAAATALITRSLARTFAALLLVNPRTAVLGAEAANAGASARVLRSGVTVVGTRPERHVRLPNVLLLDAPRVLTDGLELAAVLPLTESADAAEIRARAAAVAAAAGSPWGSI